MFDENIQGVWTANKSLSWVFDTSLQKLKSKQRSKIVKIYVN